MARLFPDCDPEKIPLKPERDVARALVRDLPNECLIYHSYSWLRRDQNGIRETLHEGETDFLILDPRYGLLVIEVKGGDVRHRVKDGKDEYFRVLPDGGERRIGNPFEQARHSMHTIADILKISNLPSWYDGCFGYAVAFPDQINRGSIPNDADNSIIFLAEHLDDMERAVRRAFQQWNRRPSPSISSDAMKICRERLRPVFGLLPARWRELESDEEHLITLTTQQQQVLEGLSDNRRIAIRGGAGTGKTMLALWKAVAFAREGLDTIFLCFNRFLAEWLNDRMNEELDAATRSKLMIHNFHGLCREFYRRANVPFVPPDDPSKAQEFWSQTVPNKLFDVLLDETPHLRFDAIIVDEAQDFQDDWWLVVDSLNCEHNGRLSIFYDPNQNIFNNGNAMPQTDAVFNLTINCRNTQEIHKYSVRNVTAEVHSSPRVPKGTTPTEITVTDASEQRGRCEATLKSWKTDYRMTADRLAVLSHRKRESSCFAGITRVAGMPITERLDEWKKGNGILFSTFAAFKGLEADAIVLLTSQIQPPSPNDLYVASSRAKHLLAIIETTSS